jgi:hypothetical protein
MLDLAVRAADGSTGCSDFGVGCTTNRLSRHRKSRLGSGKAVARGVDIGRLARSISPSLSQLRLVVYVKKEYKMLLDSLTTRKRKS